MVKSPCQHGLLLRPPPRAAFGLVATVAWTSQMAKPLVGEVISFPLLGTIADRSCLPQTPSSSLLPSRNCTRPEQSQAVIPTSQPRMSDAATWLIFRAADGNHRAGGTPEAMLQKEGHVSYPAQTQLCPMAPLWPLNLVQLSFREEAVLRPATEPCATWHLENVGTWVGRPRVVWVWHLPWASTAKNASKDFLLEIKTVNSHSETTCGNMASGPSFPESKSPV